MGGNCDYSTWNDCGPVVNLFKSQRMIQCAIQKKRCTYKRVQKKRKANVILD